MKNKAILIGLAMLILGMSACAPMRVCPTYLKNTKNINEIKKV
ncbi:MAG: hypothetical protein SFY32_02940 [Bacteroidota bacterium]|nr:hypothetical protein [Bacteroidota bacterium]